jgi:hypothetical protein
MVRLDPEQRQHLRLALSDFLYNFVIERVTILPHTAKLTAERATQECIDSLTRCDQCGLITCEHGHCRGCAQCFECDTLEAKERISDRLRFSPEFPPKSIMSLVDDSFRNVRREEN